MNFLSDVITYVRRLIKSPSNADISDDLIIDYINRFWINDVDARLQLFDLKKKYQFQTTPGVDRYNMPLYDLQVESPDGIPQNINMYPVYQGFASPAYVNGVQVTLQTQRTPFFNLFPNIVQPIVQIATGDGGPGPYTFQIPLIGGQNTIPNNPPVNALVRGHVDMMGIIATGVNVDPPITNNLNAANLIAQIPVTSVEAAVYITATGQENQNVVVSDSGIFFDADQNYGLLIEPGNAPFGNQALPGIYEINSSTTTISNTINYLTGEGSVTFPVSIPVGVQINAQCYYYQSGLPRAILYYNNVLTLRTVPSQQYLVELDAYLSPAAFLTTSDAIQFGYMSEYIARGAARKILSDTGDIEQFNFYEPLFEEQEKLVWKRSQRQFTNNRTETIYSSGYGGGYGYNNYSGGVY